MVQSLVTVGILVDILASWLMVILKWGKIVQSRLYSHHDNFLEIRVVLSLCYSGVRVTLGTQHYFL